MKSNYKSRLNKKRWTKKEDWRKVIEQKIKIELKDWTKKHKIEWKRSN